MRAAARTAAPLNTDDCPRKKTGAALAHSHLVVKHLLRQLVDRRARLQKRALRPEWLSDLAERLSSAFAPMQGLGRVGFGCDWQQTHWELRLFLGELEVVGGKDDGARRPVDFELDLSAIHAAFDRVHEMRWLVFSQTEAGSRSFLSVRGDVGGNPVAVKFYSHAPIDSAPGIQHPSSR